MADVVKPEVRSRMMSGIRGKDTQPELVLRRGLFARGYRFRLHGASLPGRPDIVIRKYRTVILVHGCFWHAHIGCRYFHMPEGNHQFWKEKLGRNRERDAHAVSALQTAGWRVAIIWECATRASASATLGILCKFLRGNHDAIEISTSGTRAGLAVRAVEPLSTKSGELMRAVSSTRLKAPS